VVSNGGKDSVSTHDSPQSEKPRDPYAFYASSVGPRLLDRANTIYEDFPVSKYVLYYFAFVVEIAAVFYIGIKLIH
jgi:hypothetical protein